MGSGDMLEVAHMGLNVAQMTSQKGIRNCFDAVTVNAAKVMHLQGYGLEPGCDVSFVLLQAGELREAIRLRANRLKVWRKGTLVAESAQMVPRLRVEGRPENISFMPTVFTKPQMTYIIRSAIKIIATIARPICVRGRNCQFHAASAASMSFARAAGLSSGA